MPGIGAIIDAGKPTERVCNDVHCGLDTWRNDISGHGGLTKQGIGTLVLTGANTYAGPTLVNQGRLAINGSLLSAVTVNDSGILGGNGRIGALTAKSGGTVAPGNSIGTLQVAGDVTFEPGSTYAVELSPTSSDQIVAGGKAVIDGATVSLSLENSPTLLTTSEVKSLLGNQYNILQAAGGIEGRFGAVLPGLSVHRRHTRLLGQWHPTGGRAQRSVLRQRRPNPESTRRRRCRRATGRRQSAL